MSGGVPTISFRDLAIQRRENDLVGASFGRGFFILDDYTFLRDVSVDQLRKEATLFTPKKAWWYIPRPGTGFEEKAEQGAGFFTAPNPPFGAVFTYHLATTLKTLKDVRQEKEKELVKAEKSVPFPGWESIETERRQEDPAVWLTVKDAEGNVVRRVPGSVTNGFHRVAWDLRYPSTVPVQGDEENPGERSGVLAAPGTYTVTMVTTVDGVTAEIAGPVSFTVERLYEGALPGATPDVAAAFWQDIASLRRSVSALSIELRRALDRVEKLGAALARTPAVPGELDAERHAIRTALLDLDEKLNGNRAKREIGERVDPTISSRLGVATTGVERSTYGPTPTHERSLEIAKKEFRTVKATLEAITGNRLPAFENMVQKAGAPWIEGQPIPDPD